MIRDNYFQKLQKEATGRGQITRLALRIGIPIVTLWRIINGKSKGSVGTWDAIFKYYGK
jgi:predicted transcriptional regulator